MAAQLSPEAFVARYGPLADDISKATGLHPTFVLGQAAHESNWGNNFVGNNIFGISRNDRVVEYPDISTGAQAYVDTIKRRYSGAAKLADPKEQARVVASLGYATDPAYLAKVTSRINKVASVQEEAKAPSIDDVMKAIESSRQPASANAPKPEDEAAPSVDDVMRAVTQMRGEPASGPPGEPGQIDPLTGQKFQFVGNIPKGDPVGESLGKPIEEGRLPGAGTRAITSLSTDQEQKRRIMASQLFPDLPPAEGQARVFYGSDGRMAAVGTNGRPFYVDPVSPSLSRPETLAPTNLLRNAPGIAGAAIPAVAGAVAGTVAAPTSLVMGPLAAGAGAMAGDAARQYLASRYDPQSAKTDYNVGQTVGEGVGGAIGQAGGAMLTRYFAPNLLGGTPLDINRIRAGQVRPEAERLNALALDQGVTLTPGQASGLPSLLGHEDAITSGAAGPNVSDIARARYIAQGKELRGAGDNMLSQISPVTDKTDATMQFQQGAEDAIRIVRQDANRAARPSYQAAERAGNVMSPELAQLAETPAMQTALKTARVQYENLYRRAAPDNPDFALWDLAKRELDDMHTISKRAGEHTSAMSVDSIRKDLLTNLDTAYPTYPTAREIAAPGQRLSARLQEVVGSAVGDGTEKARAIIAPVMEGSNPRAIAEARDAFAAAGREGEWNMGVRAYIQDAFDRASQSQAGLNPSILRKQIWGKVDNRDAIQAALGPEAYHGFDNFMQVVEAMARTYPMNSLTAPRLAAANALQSAAADTGGVKAAQGLANALNPGKLIGAAGAIPQSIANRLTARNLGKIADRLFSDRGMEYLRTMGDLSPGSQKALTATAEFIGQQSFPAGVGAIAAGYNRMQDSAGSRQDTGLPQ